MAVRECNNVSQEIFVDYLYILIFLHYYVLGFSYMHRIIDDRMEK